METTIASPRLQGLAQILVMDGLIDEKVAIQAIESANKQKISFVNYVIEKKLISATDIARLASKDFGLPLFDLDCFDRESMPVDLISDALIRKHNTLPLLQRGNRLYIAISDPSQQSMLTEIQFQTGLKIVTVIVHADKLEKLIEDILSAQEDQALAASLEDSSLDDMEISADEAGLSDETSATGDDAPIVRFVNKILLDAINAGASDIHFEPYEKNFRVRFRQDGILHEAAQPPMNLSNRIISRLKIMSQLDISERRIPQDGRFKMKISQRRSIDFRVSTCPTVNGEKVVMRVLDSSATKLGIESLGFYKDQEEKFVRAINEPQGMILVTGPTGSGKTVTLYTALNLLNTPEKNISTAEDPVEIKLQGVNQVNINPKTGLTFSSALRSFLRQDPDIIMVGEMRDLETAEIGIKAAQTGHLVLSTLHTNSAPETLTRLANMGIPLYNIAGSTNLIIAQRLARKLCVHCKQTAELPKEMMLSAGFTETQLKTATLFEPKGCDQCTQGYKGRIGLFEVLEISDAIQDIILRGGNAMEITKQGKKEGMMTILESGLAQVASGNTSLQEINRVTKD